MSEAIAKYEPLSLEVRRKVILDGDLSGLTPAQLEEYYLALCRYLNLEPSTRPFVFIKTRQGLTLYVTSEALNQLRRLHNISCRVVEEGFLPGTWLYRVKSESRDPNGRFAEDIGVKDCEGLRGDDLANAMMKTVTKAHDRSTRRLIGISLPAEQEAEGIPDAVPVATAVEAPSQPDDAPAGTATKQQIKMIHALARKAGLTKDEYQDTLRQAYGVESSVNLTPEQASEFIDYLQSLAENGKQTEAPEPQPEPESQLPQLEVIKQELTRLGYSGPEQVAIRSAITSSNVDVNDAASVLRSANSKEEAIQALRMIGVPNPFKTQQVSRAAGA